MKRINNLTHMKSKISNAYEKDKQSNAHEKQKKI